MLNQQPNHTMLCDFYELTMANGYFKAGVGNKISYFDVFFRRIPDGGGFAIAAGLDQIIDYIENLHFTEEDIAYLRTKGIFDEEFLAYLRTFRFTGDIYAVPEGTPVFPYEPILTVRAPAMEAQFIETFLLLTINHQAMIATKANRIVRAADGRSDRCQHAHRQQGLYDPEAGGHPEAGPPPRNRRGRSLRQGTGHRSHPERPAAGPRGGAVPEPHP